MKFDIEENGEKKEELLEAYTYILKVAETVRHLQHTVITLQEAVMALQKEVYKNA